MKTAFKILLLVLFIAGVYRLSKSEVIKSIFNKPVVADDKGAAPIVPVQLSSPPSAEIKAQKIFASVIDKLQIYGGYLPFKYVLGGGNPFGSVLLGNELRLLNNLGYDLTTAQTTSEGLVPQLSKLSERMPANTAEIGVPNAKFGL